MCLRSDCSLAAFLSLHHPWIRLLFSLQKTSLWGTFISIGLCMNLVLSRGDVQTQLHSR